MLSSLANPLRRRGYAGQAAPAPLSTTRASGLDLNNPEVLQLVHDLRNQLMVLTVGADAIQTGMAHDPAGRLSELQHAAEQAVLLLNAILADEHPPPAARRVVDGNEVVRRTARTLSHLKDDAVHLRLDLWTEPLRVAAVPGTLDRVLLNLVLNALDAMPEGGILTIETAVAHAPGPVGAMRPGSYARLTVSDTGCGMHVDVKDRIFDAFFTTKQNGTGLGLHSVAVAIQQLQGRIAVESEPGHGTSVTVMLPLAPD